MVLFVIGIIVLLLSLAFLAVAPKKTKEDNYGDAYPVKVWGFIPLILALVFILLSCFTVVGTRNVGVATTFGKPTGETYDAGLTFKAPWVSVTDIDATIQPEEYKNDKAIYVKIADGGTAEISVAYRWRINPDTADKVFADYRKSDKDINDVVRTSVVSTNIKAAINEVFGSYDPLDGVDLRSDMTPEELANVKIKLPDLEQFNTAIEENVKKKIADLGNLVNIQAVTVSYVKLPDNTQKRINAFNAAVQDTKIALQEVATKDAQAKGNEALAKSLQDPNVLVSKCFDAIASGDFKPPAGFSCWPGATGSVVIPSAK